MTLALLKRPSALLPIALSVAALALVAGFILLYGTQHQGEDEGATAHVWQLLILAHGPAILFITALHGTATVKERRDIVGSLCR